MHIKAALHDSTRRPVASARRFGSSAARADLTGGRCHPSAVTVSLTAVSDGWRVILAARKVGPYSAGAITRHSSLDS